MWGQSTLGRLYRSHEKLFFIHYLNEIEQTRMSLRNSLKLKIKNKSEKERQMKKRLRSATRSSLKRKEKRNRKMLQVASSKIFENMMCVWSIDDILELTCLLLLLTPFFEVVVLPAFSLIIYVTSFLFFSSSRSLARSSSHLHQVRIFIVSLQQLELFLIITTNSSSLSRMKEERRRHKMIKIITCNRLKNVQKVVVIVDI